VIFALLAPIQSLQHPPALTALKAGIRTTVRQPAQGVQLVLFHWMQHPSACSVPQGIILALQLHIVCFASLPPFTLTMPAVAPNAQEANSAQALGTHPPRFVSRARTENIFLGSAIHRVPAVLPGNTAGRAQLRAWNAQPTPHQKRDLSFTDACASRDFRPSGEVKHCRA
jgi:hypothetical protein